MDINKINNYNSLISKMDNQIVNNKTENSFGDLLSNALDKVNEMQLESQEYKKMLAIGEVDNLHDVTIAADKADTALQVVMAIRGKVVEAYKEIMRIQI
ncbi:flagellar hook-basal body complex protein FliE [Tissierella sp. MB52-C2]|uniref:flagellar hook-basal body complex protein FliE n=1 Tax=Tissierella sp. MB52-C2 TaxID=3070999 RepID=UPI00280B93AE|nr:flagellar hook-basal body complex protein FliE [Tissierella sp. MB52-C2]WMM26627.1 flagellar hook-basal body complex protein FliE [Tissierella sp. MB52-C2]